MTEEKKEAPSPSQLAPAASTEQHNAAPKQEAAPLPKQEMSKGERWYNWIVYSGINYWVNLVSSVAMADVLIFGKGRKPMDWAIGKVAKGLEASGMMKLKSAYHNSKTTLETLTLLSGGTLLLVPMKILEDHKRSVVHWLNDKLGVDQTAPDGHKQTPDEIFIECEQPKQSWWTAIKRRVYAIATVAAVGQVIEHTMANKGKILPGHSYDLNPYDATAGKVAFDGHHQGGKDRATESIMSWVNKGAEMVGVAKPVQTPWVQRWLGLAALDTFFTKVSAVVMKVTNGAKQAKAPHEITNEKSPAASFEIGDDLKKGEERKPVIIPAKRDHATGIGRKKEDSFSAAVTSRKADAACNNVLGA